ncbi:MAG TPA: cytochrome b [Povalibacter sp.]|nr:cytochrome b [Povalibacter sp.]
MQIRNTELRYGAIAQLLHWIIVALIITQLVLAFQASGLPAGPAKIAVLARHKSFGMTIFGLAVLRLTWRLFNPVPPMPLTTPRWQRIAAHVSHGALYALIMITPLFGWMMSSARNFPVSWFGLFTFPDLVQPDKSRYEFFHTVHESLAFTLAGIALLHAAAALKHHFIDHDDVLRRMLPARLKSPPR